MPIPWGAYLRLELHTGSILPAWAHRVEDVLARRHRPSFEKLAHAYMDNKSRWEGERQASHLRRLAATMGGDAEEELMAMTPAQLDKFMEVVPNVS